MTNTTQISAFISKETKSKVDAYVKSRGIKKAFLVEEALLNYLQAANEIPEEILIPSQLTLTKKGMDDVLKELERESQPTAALKSLFRGE